MEEIGKIKNRVVSSDLISIVNPEFKYLSIDSFIKTVLLSTLAGYAKTNKLKLQGQKLPLNLNKVEKFISYILNDRYFAPIKYNIKISNYIVNSDASPKPIAKVERHDYNCVILFSGGFDSSSTLLYSLDKGWNPLLVWIGFGQKNEATEMRIALKLAKIFKRELVIIKLKLHKDVIKGWKDWSYIVPCRNLLFATFAAAISASSNSDNIKIMMGVTNEEYYHPDPGTDKSPRFFTVASELLSSYYHKNIELGTPLKSVSKAELAAHWNNYWFKKYGIDPHTTISCYFGNNCGTCNSCFKRSTSFLAGNIGLDKDLKRNPFTTNKQHTNLYIERIFGKVGRKTKFGKKRATETLIAYTKILHLLPVKAKNLVSNTPLTLKEYSIKEQKRLEHFIWNYEV